MANAEEKCFINYRGHHSTSIWHRKEQSSAVDFV